MNKRTQLLQQLISEGIYVVDEAAVAESMMLRAAARRAIPGLEFSVSMRPPVRSFRRADNARSFRLIDGRSRNGLHN